MHVIDNHCISLFFICFYTTALTLDAFRLFFYAFDTFDAFQWPGRPAWNHLSWPVSQMSTRLSINLGSYTLTIDSAAAIAAR